MDENKEHFDYAYFDGKIVDGYTFVELYWFARDEKIKKEVADFARLFPLPSDL